MVLLRTWGEYAGCGQGCVPGQASLSTQPQCPLELGRWAGHGGAGAGLEPSLARQPSAGDRWKGRANSGEAGLVVEGRASGGAEAACRRRPRGRIPWCYDAWAMAMVAEREMPARQWAMTALDNESAIWGRGPREGWGCLPLQVSPPSRPALLASRGLGEGAGRLPDETSMDLSARAATFTMQTQRVMQECRGSSSHR